MHRIKALDLASKCIHTHHSPPDVAALGEGGGLDDLRGHPGVGARRAHLGGLVPLSRQAEVGDLQRQTFHTVILYGLSQEDWRKEGRKESNASLQRIIFAFLLACNLRKKV